MGVIRISIRILKALKSHDPDSVSLGREHEPGIQSSVSSPALHSNYLVVLGKSSDPFGASVFSFVKWKVWTPEFLRSFEPKCTDTHSYLSILLVWPRKGGGDGGREGDRYETHAELSDLSFFHTPLALLQPPIPSCSSNMLSCSHLWLFVWPFSLLRMLLPQPPPPFTHAHRGFHGSPCHLLQEAFLDYLSKVAHLATFCSFLLLILPDVFVYYDVFPPLKHKLHEV